VATRDCERTNKHFQTWHSVSNTGPEHGEMVGLDVSVRIVKSLTKKLITLLNKSRESLFVFEESSE
jgi:hypothetical protein